MGKIKTLNQDKQQEQKYPRLENGQVDFMTIIAETFQGQIGVVQYVQGICKGFALDKSLQTAHNLMNKLDEGITNISMDDIIPEDIKPKDVKVSESDIN
tara:strand:- start:1226 stop:1522 length:297 start_codon:yes stop_codon:yes gene_type:complete